MTISLFIQKGRLIFSIYLIFFTLFVSTQCLKYLEYLLVRVLGAREEWMGGINCEKIATYIYSSNCSGLRFELSYDDCGHHVSGIVSFVFGHANLLTG